MISQLLGLATAMKCSIIEKIKKLIDGIPPPVGDPVLKLSEALAGIECSCKIQLIEESEVFQMKKSS